MVLDENDECLDPVSACGAFPAFLDLIVKKIVFVI
jgi:hypothetical protein